MSTLPVHVFTLMCEDIRKEEFGKLSLLGVYGDNIYFKNSPMRLRSVAFLNRLSGGDGVFRVSAKLRGVASDLTPLIQITADARFPPDNDTQIANMATVFANVEFKEEGRYHYEVFFNDDPQPAFHFEFKVSIRPDRFPAQ